MLVDKNQNLQGFRLGQHWSHHDGPGFLHWIPLIHLSLENLSSFGQGGQLQLLQWWWLASTGFLPVSQKELEIHEHQGILPLPSLKIILHLLQEPFRKGRHRLGTLPGCSGW